VPQASKAASAARTNLDFISFLLVVLRKCES
jgi:hypothetical protein